MGMRKLLYKKGTNMKDDQPLFLHANYHTHTPRCHHAVGEEREYIEEAIAAGMTTLGFSDHAPAVLGDFYSGFRMAISQMDDYFSTLSALREEYQGKIRILIGYEMEYYPDFFRSMLRDVCTYPIDYLILGQHFLENEITGYYAGNAYAEEARLSQYVSQVLEGLSTGAFSYLAHPDLFRFTGDEAVYTRHMTRLCEGALALDIPLEINLYGLADHRHYPSERFFRIAKAVGNRLLFGCDAHAKALLSDAAVRTLGRDFIDRLGVSYSQDLQLKNPHTAYAAYAT